MKYEKETTGTKNPNVVVKKSALEEFLEEWDSWRGKRKDKAADKMNRESAEMTQGSRIKRGRKRNTNFMDSGFMLVIKMFAGLVDIIFSMVMWVFSLVFSFKFWAVMGVIIYFSDVKIETIEKVLDGLEVKEAIEKVEDGAKGIMKELDGLEIQIKQEDGSVKTFGTGPVMGWNSKSPLEPESEKSE